MGAVVVQLRSQVAEPVVKKMAGKLADVQDATLLVNHDADVYRPDGTPLLMVRKGVLKQLNEDAYEALHFLRTYRTDNRGVYTGVKRATESFAGRVGKNTRTRDEQGKLMMMSSAIIGYFDRQGGRHPFCRTTRFTATEPERWKTVLPMVRKVDELMADVLPDEYAEQRKACSKIHPAWIIEDTAFSTMTVNNNAVATFHQDKGDYKKGFGVISCLRRGEYTGGWLCFPKYRVGVDLQDGDVLFFNPHEWHGMTPIEGDETKYERITCVYYLREKLGQCGTPQQEVERAKRVRGKV